MKHIESQDNWQEITTGEAVELSGELITARDATLQKIFKNGAEETGFLEKKIIYFCGPTPPPPGKIIGSCGPTTSSRMEPFLEYLGKSGVRALIGKGEFSESAKGILKKYNIRYFAAIGGIGALLSQKVISAEIIKFPELGTEAMYQLKVKNFPVILAV